MLEGEGNEKEGLSESKSSERAEKAHSLLYKVSTQQIQLYQIKRQRRRLVKHSFSALWYILDTPRLSDDREGKQEKRNANRSFKCECQIIGKVEMNL